MERKSHQGHALRVLAHSQPCSLFLSTLHLWVAKARGFLPPAGLRLKGFSTLRGIRLLVEVVPPKLSTVFNFDKVGIKETTVVVRQHVIVQNLTEPANIINDQLSIPPVC